MRRKLCKHAIRVAQPVDQVKFFRIAQPDLTAPLGQHPERNGTVTTFSVPDMSCQHCKASILEAVEAVDTKALLTFDLDHHEVMIENAANLALVTKAMAAAGYPATAKD
jgi:copper chaperone